MTAKMIFERALFNKLMWHETTEEEVKRVFSCNFAGYDRLLAGEIVASPFGTGVMYRLALERRPGNGENNQ